MLQVTAAIEIQRLWRTHQWINRIGADACYENTVIIQRCLRSFLCQKYVMFVRALLADTHRLESLVGKDDELIIRISGETWPPTILFKTINDVTHWSRVDSEPLAEFKKKELRKARQQTRANTKTAKRKVITKDVKQRKREQIRKKSQLKWKWFYESKSNNDVVSLEQSYSTPSNGHEVDDEIDVMEWLTNLKFE